MNTQISSKSDISIPRPQSIHKVKIMSKQLNIFECEKNMLDLIFQKQYPYADESKRMPMFIREQDKTITIRKHLEDEILLNK